VVKLTVLWGETWSFCAHNSLFSLYELINWENSKVRQSEIPQFRVRWCPVQLERHNRDIVGLNTVQICLHDPERAEAVRVSLCCIVSDGPALNPVLRLMNRTFIQDDPLLKVIRRLKLPRCHLPQVRVCKSIGNGHKFPTLQSYTTERIRLILCSAFGLSRLFQDITGSPRIQS